MRRQRDPVEPEQAPAVDRHAHRELPRDEDAEGRGDPDPRAGERDRGDDHEAHRSRRARARPAAAPRRRSRRSRAGTTRRTTAAHTAVSIVANANAETMPTRFPSWLMTAIWIDPASPAARDECDGASVHAGGATDSSLWKRLNRCLPCPCSARTSRRAGSAACPRPRRPSSRTFAMSASMSSLPK